MSTYKWTGVVVLFAFAAAWYGAAVPDPQWSADVWIVAAFVAAVLWAFAGPSKATVYQE